jgi:hypothetical protein
MMMPRGASSFATPGGPSGNFTMTYAYLTGGLASDFWMISRVET